MNDKKEPRRAGVGRHLWTWVGFPLVAFYTGVIAFVTLALFCVIFIVISVLDAFLPIILILVAVGVVVALIVAWRKGGAKPRPRS